MAKVDPQTVLHIDFETFSSVDITKCGAHKYAQGEDTRALCAAWAFGYDEPELWLPGEPCPPRVADHIMSDGEIAAWNAQFERLIMKYVMPRLYGWPEPRLEQYRCIMVQAYAMALPGKLENCAPAIGLEKRKDDKGKRIMLQLCKPRVPTKKFPLPYFTPQTHPEKFAITYEYCKQDVRVEQGIDERTVRLIPSEQELYWRDQRINDRGVPIDMELVEAAQIIIDDELPRLDAEMRLMTDGAVVSCSATSQLRAWLNKSGVECKSVDKDSVLKLLGRDDLSNSQRAAIMLRQEAAKSSTAKLNSFRAHVGEGGRIYGTLQFHGAMTGRDAGRGVQVQNFPRPRKGTDTLNVIKDLIQGQNASFIRDFHGSPMLAISDILRGVIRSHSGKVMFSRDLSQIEARLTAYLAGQHDKVEAFAKYDRGEGPDIYIVTAAGTYNVKLTEINAADPRRQVGKVEVLALGFGGGASAFGSMAKLYQVDLVPLYNIVSEIADPEHHEKVQEGWKARGRSSGMHKKAWYAAEYIKLAWRDDNEEIVQHWKNLETAAIDALMRPGATIRCRDIRYRKTGSFLRCILPSGRSIFYPFARLVEEPTPWGKMRTAFRFKGVNGLTKQWQEFAAYGGFLHQNTVQAVARDVMMEAMIRLEDAGYPNVMRVHDELVHEVDDDFGDEDEFHALVVQQPTWAPGLSIAADGWRKVRYGK